jgi:hypothetical protein
MTLEMEFFTQKSKFSKFHCCQIVFLKMKVKSKSSDAPFSYKVKNG